MKTIRDFIKTARWLSFLFLLLSINSSLSAQVKNYPVKTGAYWTKPTMSESEIQNLAKHDVVIADLENKFNNRETLVALKQLNPRLKLLCYSNPMEIFLTKYATRPWQNKIIDELTSSRQAWLLKTITPIKPSGSFWKRLLDFLFCKPKRQENYATFWPGMIMINMSSACPQINGETYSDWIAKKTTQEVLSDPIWDGKFDDNGTIDIAWTHPGKIDIDGDKKADRDELVNYRWKQGMESYMAHTRLAKGQNFIMVSNKGDLNLLDKVNGKFFENFSNDYLGGDKWANGWRQCLRNAIKTGPYTFFQVNRSNIVYGLASTLMLDNVYLVISQDDSGYFSDLEIDPGLPLGPCQNKGGIYTRDYEKAIIMIDPLKKIGKITMKK